MLLPHTNKNPTYFRQALPFTKFRHFLRTRYNQFRSIRAAHMINSFLSMAGTSELRG